MRIAACMALLSWLMLAQPQAKVEFEVASVKPTPPSNGGTGAPGCQGGPSSSDPARLRCHSMSPGLVITLAYAIKSVQVAGPDWLSTPRFEIEATLPAGATGEQVAEMWRSFLADRFHCVAHHESREMTAFELVVAKGGPLLKPAVEGLVDTLHSRPAGGYVKGSHLNAGRMTMAGLADFVAGQLRKPVTDATGLTGAYAVLLSYTREGVSLEIDSAPPLPQALEEELGLRLQPKKGPVDVLVIDQIDRAPTGN